MRYLRQLLLVAFLCLGAQFALAGTIDINSANAEVLAAELHGVGEKKAAEIIKYREANGGFKSIEELINVKGIGGTILDQNRGRIVAGVDDEE
ncbi:MAG: helix-hairpin-helix domain-containing protein [Gammaproteobacteria bacterium]|nr:helix-hairpin-helix domain-containing protein [Gammaproteobacteria bacterium]